MTTRIIVNPSDKWEKSQSKPRQQHVVDLEWKSREKWYAISRVTLTHNPDFPTPAISIIQPQPGIRFNVYNLDGELVYSNKKTKDQDND